jgi:hypothetical protein
MPRAAEITSVTPAFCRRDLGGVISLRRRVIPGPATRGADIDEFTLTINGSAAETLETIDVGVRDTTGVRHGAW